MSANRRRSIGRREADRVARRNRQLLIALYVLVCLNWLHDLTAVTEMFDWWDGRTGGFLSTELEHELTVMGPLVAMIFVPIVVKWLDVRFANRGG